MRAERAAFGRECGPIQTLEEDLAQLLQLYRNRARRQPCDTLRRASDPIEREVERARLTRGLVSDALQSRQTLAGNVAKKSQVT